MVHNSSPPWTKVSPCEHNEKVELSKGFIINNISYFTLRFVFTKIKKAEDVEQLIDLIINTYYQQKGKKVISNQVLKILNQIKRVNEDLDYDFYEKILEKYKIEISISLFIYSNCTKILKK